jgi:hypothetical protein
MASLEKVFKTNINVYQVFVDIDQENEEDAEVDEEAALQEVANDPNRDALHRELLDDAVATELVPGDPLPASPGSESEADSVPGFSSDDDDEDPDHYAFRQAPRMLREVVSLN